MQYSLQALNKNSILDNFRLTDIIETLNLNEKTLLNIQKKTELIKLF